MDVDMFEFNDMFVKSTNNIEGETLFTSTRRAHIGDSHSSSFWKHIAHRDRAHYGLACHLLLSSMVDNVAQFVRVSAWDHQGFGRVEHLTYALAPWPNKDAPVGIPEQIFAQQFAQNDHIFPFTDFSKTTCFGSFEIDPHEKSQLSSRQQTLSFWHDFVGVSANTQNYVLH